MVKRVLLLSVTAGQGHNTTARAICNYLEQQGCETRVLDTGYYYSALVGKTIDRGYLLSVDKMTGLYRKVYIRKEKRKVTNHSGMHFAKQVFHAKLRRYIDEYDPDVIICSHVFPAMLLDAMNRETPLRARTIGIVTDLVFHPYWEECTELDYVTVSGDLLVPLGLRKGYRAEQILPLGIPIDPKFEHKMSPEQAREQMGLDPALPAVLVMGGSMGYGNIGKTVTALDHAKSDFQIAVVCGNNQKARDTVDQLQTQKKVVTFGYTDQVDVLMDACDLLVSKPGGLTSSEAIAKGIPMIIVNPIPGHEERNSEYLLNLGAAMRANEVYTVELLADAVFSDPDRMAAMKHAAARLGKPSATRDICDLILRLEKRSDEEIAELKNQKQNRKKKEK